MLRKIGLKMKPFLLLGRSLFSSFIHLFEMSYVKVSRSDISLKVDEVFLMEQ